MCSRSASQQSRHFADTPSQRWGTALIVRTPQALTQSLIPRPTPTPQHTSSSGPHFPRCQSRCPLSPPGRLRAGSVGKPSPECRLAPAHSPHSDTQTMPASEQNPGWAVTMARAPPASGANGPSRVSRACGPGYRFVPWAGTGPRRAGSERLAAREGSAHCAGTRLGAGGRVAGCLQVLKPQPGSSRARPGRGALEAPSRGGPRSRPPPSRPASMRPHPHKAQGLALPEGGCPLLQVPGCCRQLARVHRVPSSQPLGSLGAWVGHSHWLYPLPTTCLPPQTPSQTCRNQT